MGAKHILFPLCFLFLSLFSNAKCEVLKTINVSMPTNYGTFFGEIHYSEKDLVQALKIERIIKEDLIKVINYFEYVPHDVVHFNLDPYMKVTNGNARVFPTNIINLYNFPANNKEHLIVMENWMQGLVLHEFMHITHLDQTRYYLRVARQIFGTIAKVPAGIVPRWFTEGIAVWGESHLITGGRLNNPLFNKELLIQFKKHDFCSKIDCLDDPGVYPNGQLAYWTGAHFIEYLENKKPQTIKCLVEENSRSIPFFLNSAFKKCVGETAQSAFYNFREEYLKSEPPLPQGKQEWGVKISNAFGSDYYQRGYVLDGDRLFKVEQERFSEALVAYDLKDEVSFIGKFDLPIENVSEMIKIDDESKLLLVSFLDDPQFRIHNKVWKLVNPDTLLVERTLSFLHDPSYVISLGGENFITFSYYENKWIVEQNDNPVFTFSANDNISLVKKVGDKLLLKINDSYGMSSLILTDPKFKKLEVIYKSTSYYDLPLIKENFCVIKEHDDLKVLEWDKGVQISSIPKELFARITFAEYNDGRVFALDNRLMTTAMSAHDAENYVMKDKKNTVKVEVSEFKDMPAPTESYASGKAESYPRYDHLIPHYWFFAAGSSENLKSIGATTTFIDPMEIHTLNATAFIYPTENKLGGSFNYLQKLIGVSDQWYASAMFDQDYSKTDFSSKINVSRDLLAQTFYRVLKRRWIYTPGIFVGKSTTNDFISDRSVTKFGVSNKLTYQALAYDDLLQFFSGELDVQSNKANTGSSYLVTFLGGEIGGRFTDKFVGSAKGTFEKLYKSDFSRGIVYGGGLSTVSYKRTHEFYGLPYSNAYGNEIVSARLMGDYRLWDIYRGKNLIPFYFKELHLLFGRESLYADRIILDNNILRGKMINGLFVGPRMKMDLAYFIPANIDIIFSNIKNPNGKDVNQVEVAVSATLF